MALFNPLYNIIFLNQFKGPGGVSSSETDSNSCPNKPEKLFKIEFFS
jgi:hypothetical protein